MNWSHLSVHSMSGSMPGIRSSGTLLAMAIAAVFFCATYAFCLSVEELRSKAESGDAKAQWDLGYLYETGRDELPKDYKRALEWYRKAAEQDYAEAYFRLGWMFSHGYGVAKDGAEAAKWYRKAAEKGHLVAQGNLAVLYQKGEGVPTDSTESLKWYTKAAEQGHAHSQWNLGNIYARGKVVEKNEAEAVKWIMKAAEQGHVEAQERMGRIYENGRGVDKNIDEAIKWYTKAAEKNNADAQHQLAVLYARGEGVGKDPRKAVEWCLKSADKGNAAAYTALGRFSESGLGVPKDLEEAASWYRKAAEKGNLEGQENLGRMYEYGLGGPKDYSEALKWRHLAAEKGWTPSQVSLGRMHQYGRGVPKNLEDAVSWYRKAAEKGNLEGQEHLGRMYEYGLGAPKDYSEALKWYHLAAEKGWAPSQVSLGRMHQHGRGVPKNLDEAANWYGRAAQKGYPSGMQEATAHFAAGRGLPAEPAKAVEKLDAVLVKSPALLKSTALELSDKADFFHDMTVAYFKLSSNKDRKAGYDKVRDALEKHAAGTSLFFTVEGDFYTTYAWDARTKQAASKVTEDQFRVFEDRLKLAAEALQKAWDLDNQNGRAASKRISVAMGLEEKRPVMEQWFQRAVKANPNSLEPYWAKMLYLEPKWHGERKGKDVLEFARECGRSENWKTRVPFLLIYAHETLSKYPRGNRNERADKPDPEYFAQSDVWKDVSSVYEPYLKLNPDAHKDRSKYALMASWAGQWKVANAQFRQLGDNVVSSVFESLDELDRLRREAASKGR